MKVNELLKALKKIRNEYGNIEVMLFDTTAWDNDRDNDTIPLYEIDFDEKKKRIILYQKEDKQMTVKELINKLLDSYDMNMNVYVYDKLEENYIPIETVEIANNVYLQTEK